MMFLVMSKLLLNVDCWTFSYKIRGMMMNRPFHWFDEDVVEVAEEAEEEAAAVAVVAAEMVAAEMVAVEMEVVAMEEMVAMIKFTNAHR